MRISFVLIAALQGASAFSPNAKPVVGSSASSELASSPSSSAAKPMFSDFVDEATLFEQSSFPIKPDAMIARAKEILSPDVGIGTKDGGECLADDFEFAAAVVGPIGKEEYLNALGSFSLEEAFDITPNFFGMSVDPLQPNRVWFFNRVRGIHVGDFMGAKASGKEIVYPPQVLHLDLNEQGKVTEFGFYTADRRQGNTGGLGGAFGFMYGVGKPLPIPECRPYKRSWQFRLLNKIGSLAQKFQRKKDE